MLLLALELNFRTLSKQGISQGVWAVLLIFHRVTTTDRRVKDAKQCMLLGFWAGDAEIEYRKESPHHPPTQQVVTTRPGCARPHDWCCYHLNKATGKPQSPHGKNWATKFNALRETCHPKIHKTGMKCEFHFNNHLILKAAA